MKEITKKVAQKFADYTITQAAASKTNDEFEFWILMGYRIDNYCVGRDIYLN